MGEPAAIESGHQTYEFEAGPEQERVDEFLAARLPALSLTRIRRAIAEGDASVNGLPSAKGIRLRPGARVSLVTLAGERSSATPEPIALEILYEDADLIAVNKPAGLLVHPSRAEKSGTLANALTYHFLHTGGVAIRPGLVHRLDRGTSGVVLVAKTLRAHRIISKAFRQRRVSKRYLALVLGRVAAEAGEVTAPIGRAADEWPRWRVLDGGRPAHTRYSVRRRFAGHTLLELEPLTGRTHQLRIHCALLGHPIVGDRVYGPAAGAAVAGEDLDGHLLHAHHLAVRHPTGGGDLVFTAPVPPRMKRLLEALEIAGSESPE